MSATSFDIQNIVRSGFIAEQGPQAGRKYVAYSSTYGLRVAMGWLSSPDTVQEIKAERKKRRSESPVTSVRQSTVSDIVDAAEYTGVRVSVDYDRADQRGNPFPWNDIRPLLDQPDTVYDIPVQHPSVVV